MAKSLTCVWSEVVQQFGLADCSALLLAMEEWLTPKGRQIWHTGLSPDVSVVVPSGTGIMMPDLEQGLTASQLRNGGGAQLLKAVDLLSASAAS
jgi:carboxyl-terminal processing protease